MRGGWAHASLNQGPINLAAEPDPPEVHLKMNNSKGESSAAGLRAALGRAALVAGECSACRPAGRNSATDYPVLLDSRQHRCDAHCKRLRPNAVALLFFVFLAGNDVNTVQPSIIRKALIQGRLHA